MKDRPSPETTEHAGTEQARPAATDQDAADVNALAAFLAHPDVPDLTPGAVAAAVGGPRADLLVLLGNAVIHTVDVAAAAFAGGAARDLMVVGGRGHSTPHLMAAVAADPRYTGAELEGGTEAEVIRDLLARWHGVDPHRVVTETQSTNCGANAEEALAVLRARGPLPETVLLVQDPTMQLRTLASFRRAWRGHSATRFYSVPPFVPRVRVERGRLAFEGPEISGRWDIGRFLSLVLGEVPRLRDNAGGYGPRGRGYIAHVDVPPLVEAAFARLSARYPDHVRSVPS